MARIKLDTINEFARQGYCVRVTCGGCGKTADWHPVKLMSELQRRGVSLSVERVEQRMRCSRCGAHKAAIRPTFADGN